jgi:hypothetical protein
MEVSKKIYQRQEYIYILGRFHGRINNPLSKGEDKSKRKELNENEETLFTVLFMGTVHPSSPGVLFTRKNTIHLGTIHPRRHISPGHLHWVLFIRGFFHSVHPSRIGLGAPFL